MNRTIKNIASGVMMSIALFIVSCNNNEIPDRTPQIEKNEITLAIASLEEAGYDVDTTESGMYYILQKEGTGPLPQKGDTCLMIYNGFFLSGDMFDSSGLYYPDSIWQFRHLEVPIIPGFNEGVALLNKGAEADILVPSDLAYGAMGYGNIAPYTPLFFNLKMKDVKPLVEE